MARRQDRGPKQITCAVCGVQGTHSERHSGHEIITSAEAEKRLRQRIRDTPGVIDSIQLGAVVLEHRLPTLVAHRLLQEIADRLDFSFEDMLQSAIHTQDINDRLTYDLDTTEKKIADALARHRYHRGDS